MKFAVSIKLKKDNEKKDNGLVYLVFLDHIQLSWNNIITFLSKDSIASYFEPTARS